MVNKKLLVVIAILISTQFACATVTGLFNRDAQVNQPGQVATVVVTEEATNEPAIAVPTEAEVEPTEETLPTEEITETEAETPSSEETSDSLGVETVSGLCSHPYFPINEDYIWHYKITEDNGEISYYTIEYTEVKEDSFVIREEFSETGGEQERLFIEMKWLCTEEGLISTEYGEMAFPGTGEEDMPIFTYETLEADGINLPVPDDWEIGTTWQTDYLLIGTTEIQGTGEITSTSEINIENEIAGVESVTVEAGTFDEAVRVEGTTTITTTMFVMGMSTPFTVAVDTDTWYVENVGLVKTMERDFNSVTELIELEEK